MTPSPASSFCDEPINPVKIETPKRQRKGKEIGLNIVPAKSVTNNENEKRMSLII